MLYILILHRRILMALAEFRSLEGSSALFTIKTIVRINFWHLVYSGSSCTLHLGKQPPEKEVCPKQRKAIITSVPSAVSECISCRFKIHEKKDQKNDLQPEVISQLGISWKIVLLHAHESNKNVYICVCTDEEGSEHCLCTKKSYINSWKILKFKSNNTYYKLASTVGYNPMAKS